MLTIRAQKFGHTNILRLEGQVATGEVTCLRNAMFSQLDGGTVILDLARVTRIDARGLGLLLELREQTQSKGGEFRLVNVNGLLQQVFEITQLNSVFHMSTEDEAPAFASRERPPPEVELELAACD